MCRISTGRHASHICCRITFKDAPKAHRTCGESSGSAVPAIFGSRAWAMLLATWWAWSIWLRARNTWCHPEHSRRDGEWRPGSLGAESGPVRGDPGRVGVAQHRHKHGRDRDRPDRAPGPWARMLLHKGALAPAQWRAATVPCPGGGCERLPPWPWARKVTLYKRSRPRSPPRFRPPPPQASGSGP